MPRCEFNRQAVADAICRHRIPALSDESSQKCVSVRGGLCVVALSYTGLGHGRKGDWGHVVAIVCGLARLHLRRNLAETLCVCWVCACV